jgi:energy-coupling factor transporter ATP-binding protein EcfA2
MTTVAHVHRSVILGVGGLSRPSSPQDGPAGLVLSRLELWVVDEGTGEGAALAPLLGLGPEAADEVIATEASRGMLEPAIDGATFRVRLSAGDGAATGSESRIQIDVTVEPRAAGAPASIGRLAASARRDAVADRVLSLITRLWLDGNPSWSHLHGGALCDEAGSAVLVLGRSGAGKSTLVANLAASGLSLLTDEQISAHPAQALVAGFTRPVSVKPGGGAHLPRPISDRLNGSAHTVLVTAADLGSRHLVAGRPVLIVLPERVDGAIPSWDLVTDAHEALELLAVNNLDLARDPALALDSFAWLATSVPVVRLVYGEACDAVPVIRDLVASPPRIPGTPWLVKECRPIRTPSECSPARHTESSDEGATSASLGPVDPDWPATMTVAPRSGLVEVSLGDSRVLFDPSSRELVTLNPAASAIWDTFPWLDVPADDEAIDAGLDLVSDLVGRELVEVHGAVNMVFRRRAELVSRRIRGEVLVVDEMQRCARLSGSAAAVAAGHANHASTCSIASSTDRGVGMMRVLVDTLMKATSTSQAKPTPLLPARASSSHVRAARWWMVSSLTAYNNTLASTMTISGRR